MAKKKLDQEDTVLVAGLRSRMLLILHFIEDRHDFPIGPQMREVVETAARRGDLRTLRLAAKEIDDMTIALTSHERDGLEALLFSELGVDMDFERAQLRQAVARVLHRGRISSEKERRRLEDYAEMLEATGGDSAEIAAVRQLVGDFGTSETT